MSVNKVILLGNVGRDPEVRYVEKDLPVANFTLATTERGHTTQSGANVAEHTEWHRINVWRGLAKFVEQYVRKGAKLYIEGKLRTRTWTDSQGVSHTATEIVADKIELLDRRNMADTAPLSAENVVMYNEDAIPDAPEDAVKDRNPF